MICLIKGINQSRNKTIISKNLIEFGGVINMFVVRGLITEGII